MHSARNTLIPATIALFLSAGAYVYIFLQVSNAGSEVKSIEQKIDAEHEKARRREAVRTTLEDTEGERVELETRLVKDSTLVGFFETLEVLALEAGVQTEISRISENIELDPITPNAQDGGDTKPVQDPASGSLEWLQLDIKATGSWPQIYKVLSLVELLPYEIRHSNIRLKQLITANETVINESGEQVGVSRSAPDVWELSFTLRVLKLKTQ